MGTRVPQVKSQDLFTSKINILFSTQGLLGNTIWPFDLFIFYLKRVNRKNIKRKKYSLPTGSPRYEIFSFLNLVSISSKILILCALLRMSLSIQKEVVIFLHFQSIIYDQKDARLGLLVIICGYFP